MSLKKIGKPTKIKKTIYLIAFVILGLLFSLNLHALVEVQYLSWILDQGKTVTFYGSCALQPILQIAIWLLGIIGGFFLGRLGWQKVYIERFWEKKNT